MERIIVPLDESPLAEAILPVVAELARDREAEVILVRAMTPYDPAWESATSVHLDLVARAEEALRSVAARLEARGVRAVRVVVRQGDPAWAIGEAAESHGADLVAMATHGRSRLGRLLLGSVAAAVVRSVRVPVLLIRGELPGARWSLRKVLVPLSGEAESETILPIAAALAGPADLEIHLLEVVPPPPVPLGVGEEQIRYLARVEAERHLEKAAEGLAAKGLRTRWSVLTGPVPETITAAAREVGVDLIVMATHGRGLVGRLVFGSVADAVLRAAAVPVLLFRTPESH